MWNRHYNLDKVKLAYRCTCKIIEFKMICNSKRTQHFHFQCNNMVRPVPLKFSSVIWMSTFIFNNGLSFVIVPLLSDVSRLSLLYNKSHHDATLLYIYTAVCHDTEHHIIRTHIIKINVRNTVRTGITLHNTLFFSAIRSHAVPMIALQLLINY